MVVFLIRAYYTLIVYLCQEYCGANCGRIFVSYGGFATVFSSLLYHNKEQKKKKYKTSSFFVYGADYETRSARFCARRHAPDRRTVPRTVLCFATVFSSLLYHNKEQKKKKYKTSSFFVYGADYETRSARFCARRHAPDRRTVPRTVLCFATVFSSLSYHNRKTKKGSNECFLFVFGADYETRTRYLHLGKVTLYRMS